MNRVRPHVTARNTDIGATVAGYCPAVSLTGHAGYLGKETTNPFSAATTVWSIGPSVSQPLTGLILAKAKVGSAKAKREEAIAT